MLNAHADDDDYERRKWCWLNHTDGETGPEGEIMIAVGAIPVPDCVCPSVPAALLAARNASAADKIRLRAFFTDNDSTGHESELWLIDQPKAIDSWRRHEH